MKKTILVTGGAGFIGSHVVDTLLASGDTVGVLDNFHEYYPRGVKLQNIQAAQKHENYTLIEGDITEKEEVEKAFETIKPTHVLHLAARAGVRPSLDEPAEYARVNGLGTMNILEACRINNVENAVLASSSSVYGEGATPPFKESANGLEPVSPYGASKLTMEAYAHTWHTLYDLSITCLRFFTVYGPRNRPDMAVYKFIDALYEGREIEIYGKGKLERDFTFVTDTVQGILAALDTPQPFEIFNLGNDQPVSVNRLLELLEEYTGKTASRVEREKPRGDVTTTWADISKAKKELGYEPKVKIEEGLKKVIDWYEQQRND